MQEQLRPIRQEARTLLRDIQKTIAGGCVVDLSKRQLHEEKLKATTTTTTMTTTMTTMPASSTATEARRKHHHWQSRTLSANFQLAARDEEWRALVRRGRMLDRKLDSLRGAVGDVLEAEQWRLGRALIAAP